MSIMTEETFGPVIPIVKVKDSDGSAALGQRLALWLERQYLFPRPSGRWRLSRGTAKRLGLYQRQSGQLHHPRCAHERLQRERLRQRHGAEGIRKFCQQKTIVIDRFGLKEEFPWYPASEKKVRQIRHLLNAALSLGLETQTARDQGTHAAANSLELQSDSSK